MCVCVFVEEGGGWVLFYYFWGCFGGDVVMGKEEGLVGVFVATRRFYLNTACKMAVYSECG